MAGQRKLTDRTRRKDKLKIKPISIDVVITKPTRGDNDDIILTCRRDVHNIIIIVDIMLYRVTKCVCAAQIELAGGADAVTV